MTALLALTAPEQVPAAAVLELRTLEARFADLAYFGGVHAPLLALLARLSVAAATALELALAGGSAVALSTAGRIAAAGVRLFDEAAVRATGRERFVAMRAARACRDLYANTTLVAAEHAQSALLVASAGTAPIRILPGADPAMATLARDPLVLAATWDLTTLSLRLARFIRID